MKNIDKEFDEKFDDLNPCNEVGFTNKITGERYKEIKQFYNLKISKLLLGIDKKIKGLNTDKYEPDIYEVGYNQARKDISKLLEDLINK